MKRDMDLARSILLMLEDAPFDGGPLKMTIASNHSQDVISYHIMLSISQAMNTRTGVLLI